VYNDNLLDSDVLGHLIPCDVCYAESHLDI
jgi:hypothetical protein